METRKQTTSVNRKPDRLAYLWLVLGLVLLPFSMPNWTIPLAAWLYPIFLLRFARTQPPWRGVPLVLLAHMLVLALRMFIMFPSGTSTDMVIAFGFGVIVTLPYLLDRLLVPRLGGLRGTLVFPLAVTSGWYLIAQIPSAGTIFNPAYTQYDNLPLMQLVAVTGLWGIIFLMNWLPALVNEAWAQGLARRRVRAGLLLYGALLALVVAAGAARLAFAAPPAATVRVAGVTAQHYHDLLPAANFGALLDKQTTEVQRQAIRPVLAQVDANLLQLTRQEAQAGAKMVVWPESGATVLQEDEAAFLQQAQSVARASSIYLDMGLAVVLPSAQPPFGRDESVLIDPRGQILTTYQKAHPVPGEESLRLVPGNGQIPVVATPYGRLATVVCYDRDFLDIISRVGQANADILLVPTGDWREIDPWHTQVTTFAAIETGASQVSQADEGRSVAVDYEGNVLASTDFFTTDPQIMVAYVPRQGVHTIYASIGDLFAWLSMATLVVLGGVAIARHRPASAAAPAAPAGEPAVVS